MSEALISINYDVFCYCVVPLATTEPQERKNPTSSRFGGGALAHGAPFGVLTGILFRFGTAHVARMLMLLVISNRLRDC